MAQELVVARRPPVEVGKVVIKRLRRNRLLRQFGTRYKALAPDIERELGILVLLGYAFENLFVSGCGVPRLGERLVSSSLLPRLGLFIDSIADLSGHLRFGIPKADARPAISRFEM